MEETGTWCALVGISTQDKGATIDGDIQLYNTKLKRHQRLEGHSATFGKQRVHNSGFDSSLFSFCEKKKR
jgi:hypothetical protein